MNEKEIRSLRLFYEKRGRARYISHLDVARCMQRAIKRAELPVWYTEGFNPHIYLTFALPLSLGYESESETMDFRLVRELPLEEVERRLRKALPPDLPVAAVRPPVHDAKEIAFTEYEVTLTGGELRDRLLAFFQSPEILVEKRTKKGAKQVDIKPDCRLLSVTPLPRGVRLLLRTAAGSCNVNPTLLTDAFLQREGIGDSVSTHVLRKAVLLSDGSAFI